MAKSKSRQARRAAPYMRRAVEDDYVQQQFRDAAERLREAYRRASRKRVAAAAEDKKLYRNVREAAVSIRKAIGRIEEPPPKKHGLRKALLAAGAAGAVALLIRNKSNGGAAAEWSSDMDGSAREPSTEPAAAQTA